MWKVSYISVVRVVHSIACRYPKEAYGEERAGTVIFERLSWDKRINSGGQIVRTRDKFILNYSL